MNALPGFQPLVPQIDPLPLRKVESHPLDTIHEDESSTKGNLNILEDILLRQSGLNRENLALWTSGLRLVYGDQKTFQRLWSIKRAGAEQDLPGYGQMKWLLPVPSLFHTKMCYLKIIHKAHWSGYQPAYTDTNEMPSTSTETGEVDKSTKSSKKRKQREYQESLSFLKMARDLWHRKRISHEKNNEFYALQDFIIHNFDSRVTAAFWKLICSEQNKSFTKLDDKELKDLVNARIKRMTAHSLGSFVKSIRKELLCPSAADESDPEYRNHKQLLQTIEPYLILKYGIKHGDLGYVRMALMRMAFYFNGSSSHKYGNLMLWWAHHTASGAAHPDLQRAILANSLINTTGRRNGFKEIDIYNEHLNGHLKETWNARKNSTFDFKYVIQYASLNAPYIQEIRHNIHKFFDIISNGKHSVKPVDEDLHMLAHSLRRCSFQQKDSMSSSREFIRPAVDMFQKGTTKLRDKIRSYNATLPCDDPNDDDDEGQYDDTANPNALAIEDEGHDIIVQPNGPIDEVLVDP